MKKIVAILLLLSLSFILVSCSTNSSATNSLIALSQNETLFIGSNNAFTNMSDEKESDVYLTYTQAIIYNLRLVYMIDTSYVPDHYFRVSENSNYYHYWEVEEIESNQLLGQVTEKAETVYSYLPYANGESIVVKRTVTTSYSHNFTGGFFDKPVSYEIDLNGYFETFEELATEYPDLAKLAYTGNTSNKYYVDTFMPSNTTSNYNTFNNTYYFITSNS